MKLFLGGGGNSNDSLELDKLFVSYLDTKKPLLYIPIAIDTNRISYPKCFKWINNTFSPLGVKNIVMWTELNNKTIKDLGKFSGIYIGGGNTFKLLKIIKESNFFEVLDQSAKKGIPIYGGSAGALILGRTITTASKADTNDVKLNNFYALNFLNGCDVACHYMSEQDNIIKEMIKKHNLQKVLAIPENGGLLVVNKKMKVIGPGSTFLFQNNDKLEIKPGKFI